MTKLDLRNYIHVSFIVFMLISSCIGQVKTNSSKQSPVIIRTPSPSGFHFNMVEDTTLVSQYIRSIFQDTKGNFWFGTAFEGLCRYDGKSLTYYTELDVFKAGSVHAIAEDKKGNLWFGTNNGLFKYDYKKFTHYSEKEGLARIWINRNGLFIDKDNNVWVGTVNGVFRYIASADTLGGKCFAPFPLLTYTIPFIATESIGSILQDKAGNIWFASTENGIYRYDPSAELSASGKKIIHISEKGFENNKDGSMIQDKMGNLWFTVKDNGICKYDPSANKTSGKAFTHYTTKDGLGGNETWQLYADNEGNIWVSARGSITRYDLSADKAGGKSFKVFTIADGINCCVQTIYQDKSGNMWFGAGNGLNRFDGKRFYQVRQKGPWE
jgi:ligand-binding sensor domain-containing protein